MTLEQAHEKARKFSGFEPRYVVCEDQGDGTMYDSVNDYILETYYNGISDEHIVAIYENHKRVRVD